MELCSQPLFNFCRIVASEVVEFLRLTRSKRVNLHCLLLCGLLGASFLQHPCSFLDTFGFKTCILELCSQPPCSFFYIFASESCSLFAADALRARQPALLAPMQPTLQPPCSFLDSFCFRKCVWKQLPCHFFWKFAHRKCFNL